MRAGRTRTLAAFARVEVGAAIVAGTMRRQPCEVCGSTTRIHAHHDDYSRPMTVRWLCPSHHALWHAAHGPGLHRDVRIDMPRGHRCALCRGHEHNRANCPLREAA